MSYPTTPAFVHTGSWDDESRQHPVLKWFEGITKNKIDGRAWESNVDPSTFYSKDSFFQKPNGQQYTGCQEGWKAVQEVYGPFKNHLHDPTYVAAVETEKDKAWHIVGVANVYVDLPGEASQGEEGVKDNYGKKWDCMIPSAFEFEFEKSDKGEGGFLLTKTICYGDSGPALMIMLKRGIVNPADLGL